MKKLKERCGATLLEVMISIAMLGLLLVPISSGILMSFRINERSDEIMQARLAVSSAVETIMAVGVEEVITSGIDTYVDTTQMEVEYTPNGSYWTVTVSYHSEPGSSEIITSATTYIRSSAIRAGGGA